MNHSNQTYQIYCATPEISDVVLNYLKSVGYNIRFWGENQKKTYKWLVIFSNRDEQIGGNTIPYAHHKTIDFNQLFSIFLPKTETVKLNDSYIAEVTKDSVKVGCQTFPISIIDALVAARNKTLS